MKLTYIFDFFEKTKQFLQLVEELAALRFAKTSVTLAATSPTATPIAILATGCSELFFTP